MKTVVVWLCLIWPMTAPGQNAQPANDHSSHVAAVPISQEQGEEILNELRLIRKALEDRSATGKESRPPSTPAQNVKMTVDHDWFTLGSEQAPVTIIEFSDFQCPFCRQFNNQTLPQIKKNYIDTGKVRFVSREFPLQFHPDALQAALAVRCAGAQEHYWQMRDLLFKDPSNLSADTLEHDALQLNLDSKMFHTCLEGKTHLSDIQRDTANGQGIGVVGTPAFLIGRTDPGIIAGTRLDGAQPYARFAAEIDSALAGK